MMVSTKFKSSVDTFGLGNRSYNYAVGKFQCGDPPTGLSTSGRGRVTKSMGLGNTALWILPDSFDDN